MELSKGPGRYKKNVTLDQNPIPNHLVLSAHDWSPVKPIKNPVKLGKTQ